MKFIDGFYDTNTGISIVMIEHLGKKFSGQAYLHPDDKDNVSEFAGCEYAEIRATIDALKYERKLKKHDYKVIENFIKACNCYNNFNKESLSAKVMYRQLNRKRKEINDITKEIEKFKGELQELISRREKIMEKMKSKKENK